MADQEVKLKVDLDGGGSLKGDLKEVRQDINLTAKELAELKKLGITPGMLGNATIGPSTAQLMGMSQTASPAAAATANAAQIAIIERGMVRALTGAKMPRGPLSTSPEEALLAAERSALKADVFTRRAAKSAFGAAMAGIGEEMTSQRIAPLLAENILGAPNFRRGPSANEARIMAMQAVPFGNRAYNTYDAPIDFNTPIRALGRASAVGSAAIYGASSGLPTVSQTLSGSFQMVANEIGIAMIPAIKSVSGLLQRFAGTLENLNPRTKETLGNFAVYGTAIAGTLFAGARLTQGIMGFHQWAGSVGPSALDMQLAALSPTGGFPAGQVWAGRAARGLRAGLYGLAAGGAAYAGSTILGGDEATSQALGAGATVGVPAFMGLARFGPYGLAAAGALTVGASVWGYLRGRGQDQESQGANLMNRISNVMSATGFQSAQMEPEDFREMIQTESVRDRLSQHLFNQQIRAQQALFGTNGGNIDALIQAINENTNAQMQKTQEMIDNPSGIGPTGQFLGIPGSTIIDWMLT